MSETPTAAPSTTRPSPLADDAPELSVVVPVMNEEENVGPLVDEIVAAMETLGGRRFEMVFVDDRSTDGTREALLEAKKRHQMLRIIAHDRNCGQSSAIRSGVLCARGRTIITLDGDGQNVPADIPKVLNHFERAERSANLGMVSGERMGRKDTAVKKVSSRLANSIRQSLLGDGARDTGCGLKAFDREAYLRLPYFDHMHRYLIALMRREGYLVEFVPVGHRPRMHGKSKYGVLDRALVSIRDIMGVIWLQARCRLPKDRAEL